MELMRGATGVAAVAALGNFLQGWDSGAIAGIQAVTLRTIGTLNSISSSIFALDLQELFCI